MTVPVGLSLRAYCNRRASLAVVSVLALALALPLALALALALVLALLDDELPVAFS